MLTHDFLLVTHIDYSLACVESRQKTSKETKTAAQDAIVMLEATTIEVNAKCSKLMSICLTKLNVARC